MTPRRPEINVTPLIDVLLVLLVIFMATLPLSERSLETDLPAPPEAVAVAAPPSTIVLEYGADGRIAVNQQPVLLAGLQARLREIYRERKDKTLFIMGDASLPYKRIVAVMDAAKGAGVTKLGIVTERMRRAGREAS